MMIYFIYSKEILYTSEEAFFEILGELYSYEIDYSILVEKYINDSKKPNSIFEKLLIWTTNHQKKSFLNHTIEYINLNLFETRFFKEIIQKIFNIAK